MTYKVSIIGAGHVGTHVASSLILKGIADRIALIDCDYEKAKAQAQDLDDMCAYQKHDVHVSAGIYDDLKDSDIVVMAACNVEATEDRLDELKGTIELMDQIIPHIKKSGYKGILLSISNPCDVIAQYLHEHLDNIVIGTGTALDSARLRVKIARVLQVDVNSVTAYVLGEHGDSQVAAYSQCMIGGIPLDELCAQNIEPYVSLDCEKIAYDVMKAGWNIVEGKGSTEFGIGNAAAEVIEAILNDTHKILPVSYMLEDVFGESGVYASVPCVLGSGGVEYALPFTLSESEEQRFHKSCEVLKSFVSKIRS